MLIMPYGWDKELSVTAHNLSSYEKGLSMFTRRKKIDQELIELLDRHEQVRRDGTAIRDYLLAVLADNNNDVEKFSDAALNRATELIEQVGPGAFYWMTDIAAQMTTLAAASLNGLPTNVSVELEGQSVTAEAIIEKVVKVP